MNRRRDRVVKSENGSVINLDITTLNWLCQYILTENEYVHMSGLHSLKRLLNSIDPTIFGTDTSLLDRFNFCKEAIESKLSKKLTKREFIIEDVIGTVGNKFPNLDFSEFPELSTEEMRWIEDKVIGNYLSNSFVIDSSDAIKKAALAVQTADPTNIQEAVENFKNAIEEVHLGLRKNSVDPDDNVNELDMAGPINNLLNIIEKARSPSRKLKTGMDLFNRMIGGGFESSRVYCFFGMPGEGKSLTLKEMAYQMLKYNKGYTCKDKTKKPCILYLSMENQPAEDMQLFLNIAGHDIDFAKSNLPTHEIMNMVVDEYSPKEEGDINFVFEYRPIYSINTDWIEKKIEELQDRGYEVIAVFQDYIKRILPVHDPYAEERFKLGAIINEFKNHAVRYDIPIITASQVNREGARSIIEKRNDGNYDATMNAVASYFIGESSQINENLDACIFLVPFYVGEQKYMGFKLTKSRFRTNEEFKRFYQPYELGRPIKLMEDLTIPNTYGVTTLQSTVADLFDTSHQQPQKNMFSSAESNSAPQKQTHERFISKTDTVSFSSPSDVFLGNMGEPDAVNAVEIIDRESHSDAYLTKLLTDYMKSFNINYTKYIK